MNIKSFLYLIAGVFLCISLLSGTSPKEVPKRGRVTVYPNRLLNWNDFRKVDLIRGKSTINAICLSSCEVEILDIIRDKEHVELAINAKINLQKELTQVTHDFLARSDQGKKKQVLHHENGHFIIAQIIGYRIVRDVNGFKFDPKQYKYQLNGIIRDNFKDWKRLDSQYDAQTTKPSNKEMQDRWDRFLQSEITALTKEVYH
ncbi:hypothetical protein [Cyclobacterium sp.]|uniref:DUF922 domain-containing protein n=1 Tax=Cyclobacterium sp. TaxID=1966343 RepID=UPI001985DB52|nr:hypothetical protein [Cyclobacterium sp.]MBD3627137.1 hypothetical protein [Cyclobacterium sp.]